MIPQSWIESWIQSQFPHQKNIDCLVGEAQDSLSEPISSPSQPVSHSLGDGREMLLSYLFQQNP